MNISLRSSRILSTEIPAVPPSRLKYLTLITAGFTWSTSGTFEWVGTCFDSSLKRLDSLSGSPEAGRKMKIVEMMTLWSAALCHIA